MSIAYFVTPIVVTGCLSVISGVITAYFKHKDSSDDIPMWLYKITRLMTSNELFYGHKESGSPKSNNPGQDVSNQDTNGIKMLSNTTADIDEIDNESKSDKICVVSFNWKEDSDEQDDKNKDDVIKSLVITWSDVASVINKLLFITCLIATGISISVTLVLFVLH